MIEQIVHGDKLLAIVVRHTFVEPAYIFSRPTITRSNWAA